MCLVCVRSFHWNGVGCKGVTRLVKNASDVIHFCWYVHCSYSRYKCVLQGFCYMFQTPISSSIQYYFFSMGDWGLGDWEWPPWLWARWWGNPATEGERYFGYAVRDGSLEKWYVVRSFLYTLEKMLASRGWSRLYICGCTSLKLIAANYIHMPGFERKCGLGLQQATANNLLGYRLQYWAWKVLGCISGKARDDVTVYQVPVLSF